MAFELRVTGAKYDSDGRTVLTTTLESGSIGDYNASQESFRLPMSTGSSFEARITRLETKSLHLTPYTVKNLGNEVLLVYIEGNPPLKDLIIPCLVKGS